jgi:hypothetical protein
MMPDFEQITSADPTGCVELNAIETEWHLPNALITK